jgi:hypothetical protein
MAETLGSLVDKLTIVNIRLWHLEDDRRDKNRPDIERLRAADMVTNVNAQRNDLIDEIDLYLQDAINNPNQKKLVWRKHKLYDKLG